MSALNAGTANLKTGKYEFVVPHQRQDTVHVRKPSSNGGGHTSMLGQHAQVAYAGTLDYRKGHGLERWDNNSGHYRPPSPKANSVGLDQNKFHSLSTQQRVAAEQRAQESKMVGVKRDNVMKLLETNKTALTELRKHPENSVERRQARREFTNLIHQQAQAQGLNYSKGELDKMIPELSTLIKPD